MAKMFTNKTVAITGGTGSFGKTVLKRFLDTNLAEVRVISRDEKKQDDLRNQIHDSKLKFVIGDVRDYRVMREALHGVDYVFHAAALKQVPSCEFNPMEALKTNVEGTNNVLDASIKAGVKKVVLLSTDKAVYPINAMGLSKALAEKVLISKALKLKDGGPVFCITRYGNVIGTRGSVIPLFLSQIRQHQRVTVTDPQMTRFLMSLEDSLDLVLHAFCNGSQGDIFVQKSPACDLKSLVEALQRMSNCEIDIEIIGTRHGEKLFESLVSREEMVRVQDGEKYMRIPCDNRDLNYDRFFERGEVGISTSSDYTSHNTQQLRVDQIIDLLRRALGECGGLDFS